MGRPTGGYVLTTTTESRFHEQNIDAATFARVAEILGISQAERNRVISDTKSIYIFHGKPEGGGKP